MGLFDGDYKMTQVEQLEADWGRVADEAYMAMEETGRDGEIGIRDGFKIHCPSGREGSSPSPGIGVVDRKER